MGAPTVSLARDGHRITGGAGLTATVVDGGALASLAADGLELVQHAASAFEPGLLQLWVQDRDAGRAHPLLGSGSGSLVHVDDASLSVTGGDDDGLAWTATLRLDDRAQAWSWRVRVRNDGDRPRRVDVVHAHDVALAGEGALRANELYVSQYLDVTPVEGPWGTALAVRQNQPQDGRHPWCVLVADRPVERWASDALDARALFDGRAGDLPARRLQHEHTLAALQTRECVLGTGEELGVTFAGLLLADHPGATGPDDGTHARRALDLAAAAGPSRIDLTEPAAAAPDSLYTAAPALPCRDLTETELGERWPRPWWAMESADDQVLSFFTGTSTHVVTAAKERAVLRPHGTILRTGATLRPDTHALTATAWMSGSPLSYLTRGHATNGRVLTTVRGALGLHRAYGVRVFVEDHGTWRLLERPSVFAMNLDGATWVHAPSDGGGTVELTVQARPGDDAVQLDVRCDGARRLLLVLHTEGDGPVVVPVAGGTALLREGDDAVLFRDNRSRDPRTRTLESGPTEHLALRFTVGAADAGDEGTTPTGSQDFWRSVTGLDVDGAGAEALAAGLPWLVRDALVHYLSPRGLEQYTGGAWGTRDVAQGPLELLLALDRLDDARALVLRILAAQNEDGTWPQAFGFLPCDEGFRMEPPHGDVVHWPVLAAGRYLLASGDAGILDEQVGWFGTSGRTSSVLEHLRAALSAARAGYLPGTRLVAYGHGDWNDSLQPADPELATSMTSTWTVLLHRQSLRTLADGLDVADARDALARTLRADADALTADLRRHLLVDGELAGYAVLAGRRVVRHLVHPRDDETGLRRGSLQTVHALADDVLTPAEAAHHAALVRDHLTGADGLRLFDRPVPYRGGTTRHFRRAETATFVGREIGLMYAHAHLRWCEALAHLGDAEALWHALHQVLPAAAGAVPGARAHQANTYASSSDAAVADRAEFEARYADVLSGATGFEAGWRIYSSGPGILVRVVGQCLLGVRRRGGRVEIDPVLPRLADGLRASVPLAGGLLRLRFSVGSTTAGTRGHGPSAVRIDGLALATARLDHPYRTGGLSLPLALLREALEPGGPEVEVVLP